MPCPVPPFTREDARRVQARLRAYDVPQRELLRGINVEREHCNVTGGDLTRTAKVALVHIREQRQRDGGNYYERLTRYVEG